jgi:hypothetical protein
MTKNSTNTDYPSYEHSNASRMEITDYAMSEASMKIRIKYELSLEEMTSIITEGTLKHHTMADNSC